MKKAMITISVLLLSVIVIANTGAKIEMRNGDVIECEISMESISFITDYGELKIPISFVREIVFPAPGSMATMLSTVYENETFSGFLLDEHITLEFEGSPLKFHKDFISKIEMYNEKQAVNKDIVHVSLKTGDQFYGEILSTQATIQSSYAEIKINTDNLVSMDFEGDGNVLTSVRFESGSEIKGTIKDDFISFKLLYGTELSVSPGKIKSILFLNREVSGLVESIPLRIVEGSHNTILVEGGIFIMGDTWGAGESDEIPTHRVTLDYDFYIGKYEVTFEEYDTFCEATSRSKPSDHDWGREKRPVINVSWNDAMAYCNWLSEEDGLPRAYDGIGNLLDKNGRVTTDPSKVVGYRLPTEAEWEYAARGGKHNSPYKYSGSDNVDEVAWYFSDFDDEIQSVGLKKPNSLGIYDMSGNAYEWCSDSYSEYTSSAKNNPFVNVDVANRVIRGGSRSSNVTFVRIANRNYYWQSTTTINIGFRISKTVQDSSSNN